MTLDNTVGVLGRLLIVTSFLILGTELLRPQDLVPEENQVAAVLGKLLEKSWGRAGFWFVVGVGAGFWNTTMTNQDGWARLLSNGTHILLQPFRVKGRWGKEAFLRKAYLVGLLSVLPCALYAIVGEPVGLLKLAGTIEAVHIPIITGLTLYLNRTFLPPALRPSAAVVLICVLDALFLLSFATLFVLQLTGAVKL